MNNTKKEVADFKLGDKPIACKYRIGGREQFYGIFHRFADNLDTDDSNRPFPVVHAIVEDKDGNILQLEPSAVQIMRD